MPRHILELQTFHEDRHLIHCEECNKYKDNNCEHWHAYVPPYGFCHMATSNERAKEIKQAKWESEKRRK